ncbi:MAG: hypothetical protein R3B47_03605 [Bacteroidia bacterium]
MPNRRLRLYIMYALPALGLLGLLYTGYAPIRYQSPFTQLLPKLLFIAYLILDFKSVNRRLNPASRMMEAAKTERVVRTLAVRSSWQRVGIMLRLAFFWSLRHGRSPCFQKGRLDLGWIGILTMLTVFMGTGIVRSLNNPPQQILVTQRGIHSYIWTYFLFLGKNRILHPKGRMAKHPPPGKIGP